MFQGVAASFATLLTNAVEAIQEAFAFSRILVVHETDNIFRDNHAAGCEKYGFWFDLQARSTGPSASNNICPIRSKLGEFKGNVAHTVGRYGLRIFHDHIPREQPCIGGAEVPAVYEDFTGYMNNRSGIMGLRLGAIVFKDIKVADNKNSGI